MDRGYRKVNIIKFCTELFVQDGNDDIFGAEMVCIYEIYAELLGVEKAVVLNIGRDICIAAEAFGKRDTVSARAAHDGKLLDRPSCVVVTQSVYK